MIYGIYSFPDAPISRCGDNCFKGKQGQIMTEEDYDAFNRWLTITPILVVLAIGVGFLANHLEKRRPE